jgi:dienelactone hydrolase
MWKKLGILVVVLAVAGLSRYGYFYEAFNPVKRSFAQTKDIVEPHIKVILPTTDGPHPAVLLIHDCGGQAEPFSTMRAQALADSGYAAILVDSFAGRDVQWQKVCDGRQLHGLERSADVLVALEFARAHPQINPERLFLMGFSHGGWTVLENLTLGETLPPALLDAPKSPLRGVVGLVAYYPYCGDITLHSGGWNSALPVLMLLAAKDQTTSPELCANIAKAQIAKGSPVQFHIFPEADHGFDIQADWVNNFDPAIQADAVARHLAFMETL